MGGLATAAAGHVTTGPARSAFLAKFYDGIPEDLPQRERDRRAEAARRLHFTRLALKSSVKRSKRKAARVIETPRTARPEVRDASAEPTT
jgi:hypothetical protein